MEGVTEFVAAVVIGAVGAANLLGTCCWRRRSINKTEAVQPPSSPRSISQLEKKISTLHANI
jgi:hypothetical protein